MDSTTRRFSVRGFVTVILVAATGGLCATGVANHVYGFTGFSAARHAWMAAHNALGVLFVFAAVAHAAANRRAVVAYVRNTAADAFCVRKEAAWALGLMALLLLLAVGHACHGLT